MAESHKCQICGKPATVHLTQITGNKIHKIDLCEECAREKGVTDPDGYSVGEVEAGVATPRHQAPEAIVCDECGFTSKDFKKLGNFGCPSCYERFAPIISPMLRSMHRETEHLGKVPERSLARMSLHKKIGLLEELIEDAVREERFEEAARIRDELNTLRESLQKQVS
jgi:protein arginine kinase activator